MAYVGDGNSRNSIVKNAPISYSFGIELLLVFGNALNVCEFHNVEQLLPFDNDYLSISRLNSSIK